MPKSWWRVKGSLYLFLAVVLLITFALGIHIGVSYYFGVPYYAPETLALLAALCTSTALVPGLLSLVLGQKAKAREKALVDFSSWVRTHHRIKLDDIARKLGKPTFDAEKVLVEVADRGLVKGFIDRATDEFVLHEAVGQDVYVETCPRCGANLQKRFFKGETVQCPSCHSVISGPPTAPP